MAGLELHGVAKAYGGRPALRPLDLAVADGELLAVLGPSGSGKTTLLRLVAGLERADAGSVHIGGRDVTALAPAFRDVGMVFQGHALFPHLTVRRNISYGLEARGTSAREAGPRVEEVAARLGISELLERRPGRLSGGERQRVGLARALVREPSVLLLDEPLSSLDAPLRAELRREIARLHRELGLTILHVTHDQAEALALGDRIAVLRDGALDQVGSPAEVYDRPRTLGVARFVGVAQMSVVSESVLPGLGPPGVVLGVRPEDVALGEGPVEGRVELVEPAGDHALVTVAVTGGERLVARATAGEPPAVGAAVRLRVAAERVHRFDPDSGLRLDP